LGKVNRRLPLPLYVNRTKLGKSFGLRVRPGENVLGVSNGLDLTKEILVGGVPPLPSTDLHPESGEKGKKNNVEGLQFYEQDRLNR